MGSRDHGKTDLNHFIFFGHYILLDTLQDRHNKKDPFRRVNSSGRSLFFRTADNGLQISIHSQNEDSAYALYISGEEISESTNQWPY